MLLIPFGIIWFGYSIMYYGWSNLQGPGMGFADLIFPSRINKAENIMTTWPGNINVGASAAGVANASAADTATGKRSGRAE